MDEQGFERLKRKVHADCGFDLDQYSQDYVKRRLNARMMVLGLALDNWDEYAKILSCNRSEYVNMFNTFSVNVTEFFRDVSLWKQLQENLFPEIVRRKRISQSLSLRIWSAGCSTGAEPYSIAILLKEMLPPSFQLVIYATDIDEDALNQAREGYYHKDYLKNVPQMQDSWLRKYFTPVATKANTVLKMEGWEKYRISEDIRKMITTRKSNFLMDVPPSSQLDIVFCRNAMIYLTKEMKRKLIEIFHRALVQDGLLIIGKSELICMDKADTIFVPVDIKEHVYRKASALIA